jgi:hypothetical protein
LRIDAFNSLATEDPDTLRKNKRARQSTADDAKRILDAMSAFYTPGV